LSDAKVPHRHAIRHLFPPHSPIEISPQPTGQQPDYR
jgi:hypothetical protein